MRYFIFQGRPAVGKNPKKGSYRFAERLADPEASISWRANQYASSMRPGDVAFIWRSGAAPQRGVVAIMELTTAAAERQELPHEEPYVVGVQPGQRASRVYGVLTHRDFFLPATELKQDAVLSRLPILSIPRRTNYQISEEEGKALMDLALTAVDEHQESRVLVASDVGEISKTARRIEVTTSRVVRDTALAACLKQERGYRCEICGLALELGDGRLYAEAHHVRPLGRPHDGPDASENIVVVCPNHHALLDFGALGLDPARHPALAPRHIDYHNNIICKERREST